MRFSLPALVLLLSIVDASPFPKKEKAAASSSTVSSAIASSTAAATSSTSNSTSTSTTSAGSVLTASAYNDFQISDGTAGTAQDQANSLFTAIDKNNLAAVSESDLDIIQGVHDAAEDAETNAFNPAIAAASGDAATALQVCSISYPLFSPLFLHSLSPLTPSLLSLPLPPHPAPIQISPIKPLLTSNLERQNQEQSPQTDS